MKISPNFTKAATEEEKKKFWETLEVSKNFGNALFEQLDFQLNGVNINVSNNLYHYQSFIEDLFYRHKTAAEIGNLIEDDYFVKFKTREKVFDLYFRIHISIAQQNNLLLNAVPINIKLIRAPDSFLLKDETGTGAKIDLSKISIFVKRVRLFPDIQAAIGGALEKSAAKYFISRNEIKSFAINSGLSSVSIENVFTGTLPKRLIVGFVSNASLTGDIKSSAYQFQNFDMNHITAIVDGVQYPSVPYTPDFDNDLYIREYVGMYEALNQDEGIPQMQIGWMDYKNRLCFFCFDLSADGYLGGESGTLSLLKRGHIRLEMKMKKASKEPFHMIVLGQFDNLIQINKFRNVVIDY